jgi:hypothetical protein
MSNDNRDQGDVLLDPAGSTVRTSAAARRRRTARRVGLGTGVVAVTAALVLGATQLAATGLPSSLPAWSQLPASSDVAQRGGDKPDPTHAECSTDGVDPDYPAPGAGDGAAAAAASIVAAAADCDADALVALATDSRTELMFGTETPEQTFALPDTDTEHYRTLVALLAKTSGATSGGDPGNETVVWPRVATQEFRDSDKAWQEVVDAGLLTAEQAEAQRADETFGYTGMVVGIAENGTWRYYSPSE